VNKIKLTANILFSGIGAQERGFDNSGLFEIDVLTTSDISKESTLSYAAIHCGLTEELVKNYLNYPSRKEMADYLTKINLGYDPQKNKIYNWYKLINKKSNDLEKYWLACHLSKNRGDISKIEELPYADMWTVSFPCTDVSIAGAMKGLNPDSGTRSSLLWENIKLLKKAKENNELPKYILFENVKNLVGKKFINDFNNLLDVMSELGFNTYWKVLNGKDCGIPQHRERVFAMAIRKDIDTGLFTFPKPFDNGIRLKDVLETEVDEKYYLSEEVQHKFRLTNNTFMENDYKQPKQVLTSNNIENVGCLDIKRKDQIKRVYGENGISPTLNTMQGGNRQPKVIQGQSGTAVLEKYYIRKLTPKEAWRLMGFSDIDINNCIAIGIKDTHLYAQAGNSIITNCVL